MDPETSNTNNNGQSDYPTTIPEPADSVMPASTSNGKHLGPARVGVFTQVYGQNIKANELVEVLTEAIIIRHLRGGIGGVNPKTGEVSRYASMRRYQTTLVELSPGNTRTIVAYEGIGDILTKLEPGEKARFIGRSFKSRGRWAFRVDQIDMLTSPTSVEKGNRQEVSESAKV